MHSSKVGQSAEAIQRNKLLCNTRLVCRTNLKTLDQSIRQKKSHKLVKLWRIAWYTSSVLYKIATVYKLPDKSENCAHTHLPDLQKVFPAQPVLLEWVLVVFLRREQMHVESCHANTSRLHTFSGVSDKRLWWRYKICNVYWLHVCSYPSTYLQNGLLIETALLPWVLELQRRSDTVELY